MYDISSGKTLLNRILPTVVSNRPSLNFAYLSFFGARTLIFALKSISPKLFARIAASGVSKYLFSPLAPGTVFVTQKHPRTISSIFAATVGSLLPGFKIFLSEAMIIFASNCASSESGTWTAIWSPSKSALKAVQTRGWTWIAFPSIRIGRNA